MFFMDELLCRRVTKLLLPAIRASIAESLDGEHNFTQQQIADRLGVVQVAVSKYLNRRYSKQVMHLKEYIDSKKLSAQIIDDIVKGSSKEDVNRRIDKLCNENSLIKMLVSVG